MIDLADATWPEIAGTQRTCLLVLPVGSLEQHGPHLPFDTDSRVATALAHRLAAVRSDVVVAPTVPYGASGEHAAFGGTLLVDHGVLAGFLVELVRSARGAFKGVAVVSAHGGNADALTRMSRQCAADGDEVLVWSATVADGDAHAGRTETSLMLAIDPSVVRTDLAEAGATAPLAALLPRLRAEGVRPISSNGVLGDPSGATAEEGASLLETMLHDLHVVVAARWPNERDGS